MTKAFHSAVVATVLSMTLASAAFAKDMGVAGQWLQRALEISVDGDVGPGTRRAFTTWWEENREGPAPEITIENVGTIALTVMGVDIETMATVASTACKGQYQGSWDEIWVGRWNYETNITYLVADDFLLYLQGGCKKVLLSEILEGTEPWMKPRFENDPRRNWIFMRMHDFDMGIASRIKLN